MQLSHRDSGSAQAALPLATPAPISPAAWRVLLVTSLITFMVGLEITVIALAFPAIRESFPDASPSTLSWVVTTYNIGVASLLLLAGWVADRFGRKPVFLVGAVIFGIGSLASGLGVTHEMLIMSRGIQALGGAMIFPTGVALLLAAFPEERRQLALGIWGAMSGLAAAVGPTLGSMLVDAWGWRSIFLVNAPVAAFVCVTGFVWIRENENPPVLKDRKADLIGVPAGSIGVGALVLAISEGRSWGWTSSTTLGVVAFGVVLIGAFLLRSRSHPAPLFELKLFRLRSFRVGAAATMCFASAFFGWLLVMPTFVQEAWGWSVLETGFAIAPAPLLAMVVSPVGGRLADTFGSGVVVTFGGLLCSIGLGLHGIFTTTNPNYLLGLLLPVLFIGVGGGLSFAPLVGATLRDVAEAYFAMAAAGRSTLYQLAVAIGVATAVTLTLAAPGLAAMQTVWLLASVVMLCQAALMYFAYPQIPTATVSLDEVSGEVIIDLRSQKEREAGSRRNVEWPPRIMALERPPEDAEWPPRAIGGGVALPRESRLG